MKDLRIGIRVSTSQPSSHVTRHRIIAVGALGLRDRMRARSMSGSLVNVEKGTHSDLTGYTAPSPGVLTRSTAQGRLSGYSRLLRQRLVTTDRLCRHPHALQRPIFLCKVWAPRALCMDLCTLRRVAAYIERFIACHCNRNRFMDLEDRPGTRNAPGLPYTAFVNV